MKPESDPVIILSKCERTIGSIDRIFETLRKANPLLLKYLIDGIDIDFKDIQAQIKDCIYNNEAKPDSGWIPVSERLPDNHVDVLVFAPSEDDRKIFVDHLYLSGAGTREWDWGVIIENDQHKGWSVTHWMPLPEAPTTNP